MSGKLRNMTSIFLTRGNQMLMLYRQGGRVANNLWVSSAGGHFEEDELNDAQACVLRELREELGVLPEEICGLTLKYITLRRVSGEIRQNYYFFAELKDCVKRELISTEGICKWFDYEKLSELEMPFTAKYVMNHYLQEGMKNDHMYGGIAGSEGVVFIEMPKA